MEIKNFLTAETKILFKVFNGYQKDSLRIVGGAVRNFLLGILIKDYDFSTILKPSEAMELLIKNDINVIPTGIKFGTITAIVNGKAFEITSARNDINTDGRFAEVKFLGAFKDDAKRRDFTFNSLYLDFDGKIYDYFDGVRDLKNSKIKFIGEAEERIKEDFLRILRFFRFYNSYAKNTDKKYFKIFKKYRENLNILSRERVKDEFFKIIEDEKSFKSIKILEDLGILKIIFKGNLKYNSRFLKNYYRILNSIKIKETSIFLILFAKKVDLLKDDFRLSNDEFKKIKTIKNYSKTIQNINFFKIKELFFLLGDKNLVADIIIHFYLKEKKIDFKKINKEITFLNGLEKTALPINSQDLKNCNFELKEFSKIFLKAKKIFVKNKFNIKKNELLEQLK